jgi:C-terminal processing protease CtpA/Prc
LRRRWVDRHKDTSPDARYIYRMATLPEGQTDTLTFGRQRVVNGEVFKGAVALIIDGESASATVSFAGAFQDTRRGPIFGEPCLGPSLGTMGNPHLKVLPDSRIVVSLSTAVYMAQATTNWAQSKPIRPDVYIPTMWRRSSTLASQVQDWIHPLLQ